MSSVLQNYIGPSNKIVRHAARWILFFSGHCPKVTHFYAISAQCYMSVIQYCWFVLLRHVVFYSQGRVCPNTVANERFYCLQGRLQSVWPKEVYAARIKLKLKKLSKAFDVTWTEKCNCQGRLIFLAFRYAIIS